MTQLQSFRARAGISEFCYITNILVTVAFIVALAGCDTFEEKNGSKHSAVMDDEAGVMMTFSQRDEKGEPLFASRMFVNNKYLYINDDNFPNDYVLFNRKEQTIYSVTRDTNTIFVIRPKEVKGAPPIPISYRVESQSSAAIPKIDGRAATHYRYFANDAQCYDVVTLQKDFLPEVVQALREYRTVLAGEHASTVHKMPKDTLDACDLALNIYYAAKHLDTGLPIRQWDQAGRLKFMVNYKVHVKIDPQKLIIPENFKQFSISASQ